MTDAAAPRDGAPTPTPVRVSVWSDYVCPFCYLELPVLDRLRAEFRDRVEIDWRAFELRPAPEPTLDPNAPYLHRVWGRSVLPMAERRGMTLRLPPVQPRSRKALETAAFARRAGRFDPVHQALFKAFFEDGRDLGDLDVLVGIGRANGLDADDLRAALESGRHEAEVVADQRRAREIGLAAVPTMLVAAGRAGTGPAGAGQGSYEVLSGAQPYEEVRAAVEQAASRRS
jgi:predicted DsbA family dithiol-disulfide isomerase